MKNNYVVVERYDKDTNEPLPPYAYGPFGEKKCKKELESDSGVVFCLLTIDAKTEGYIADDCYMTTADDLADGAIIINPGDVEFIPLGT